jgi:malate permease and related proteins
MVDTLFNAYTPLILWTGLGLFCFRFIPERIPHLLGRGLYWVGGPLQILALTRQTHFSSLDLGLAPLITLLTLGVGLGLSYACLGLARLPALAKSFAGLDDRHAQGSFLLASTLGNTGFVGLGIAPMLIGDRALSWSVAYSMTHNLLGAYGLGVIIASVFSRSQTSAWWLSLRDVLFVPSFWAFGLGWATQSWTFPPLVESSLQTVLWLVIPCAFLLIGVRLSQLQGWSSLTMGLLPALLRSVIIPLTVGGMITAMGLVGEPRLAMVLMAGVPTAFIGLLLAEEYDLDRQIVASSIALTTLILLVMLPIWLVLFS